MSAHTISRRNVNKCYEDGLWWLKTAGEVQESRNGQVIVAPGPVITSYHRPRERVLFSDVRDANPFFHFFEALWMLAGRDDVAYVEQFVKRMRDFSDDGITLQGAYGRRWRYTFDYDQLWVTIKHLTEQPESRRAVVQMWNPHSDVDSMSRDVPCNTQMYVNVRQDFVDLTICCRSNDAIWGAHGANAVHFSYVQEYLACALDKLPGILHQFSSNYHVYPGMPRFEELWANPDSPDLYAYGEAMSPGPLLFQGNHEMFTSVLQEFLDAPSEDTGYPFLSGVAYPMWQSFQAHKKGLKKAALEWADKIDAPDWRHACVTWLTRRLSSEGK
jgi:hypothetical protein